MSTHYSADPGTATSEGLVRAIAALATVATGPFTPEELLRRLVDVAATNLGVDGMGVVIANGEVTRFVDSDCSDVARLERIQEVGRCGPCHSAIREQAEVTISDLRYCIDPTWEQYVSSALAVGMRSVAAIPLVSRGRSWGAIDLYRRQPGSWSEETMDRARLLVDVAVSYLVMAADRDHAAQVQLDLAHRATHDVLTGLPNRSLAFERLARALEHAVREDRRVAVYFVDLDCFKSVNDTHGHDAGDQVLSTVAARMTAAVRGMGSVARLGGDEFLVVCEDMDGSDEGALQQDLDALLARLHRALDQPLRIGDRYLAAGASIGLAVSSGPTDPDRLVAAADEAMYVAKRQKAGALVEARSGPSSTEQDAEAAPVGYGGPPSSERSRQ